MRSLILLLFLVNTGFCQNLIESPFVKSIVNIKSVSETIQNSIVYKSEHYGTGSIIEIKEETYKDEKFNNWKRAKVLTAAHVRKDDRDKFFVTYFDKSKCSATVIKYDNQNDLMLLDVFVPPEVEFIPISEVSGEDVLINCMAGFHGQVPAKDTIRCFPGKICKIEKRMFIDADVKPGDSGGPITYNGKLVGVISGGFEWFDDGKYTWPTISPKLESIKEFIK